MLKHCVITFGENFNLIFIMVVDSKIQKKLIYQHLQTHAVFSLVWFGNFVTDLTLAYKERQWQNI